MNFFNNNNTGCGGGIGGFAGGCDCCSLILWILILQCICGNGGGFGMDCCTLIILLLLCGGCGGK